MNLVIPTIFVGKNGTRGYKPFMEKMITFRVLMNKDYTITSSLSSWIWAHTLIKKEVVDHMI